MSSAMRFVASCWHSLPCSFFLLPLLVVLIPLEILGLAPTGFAQTPSLSAPPVATAKVKVVGAKAKALVHSSLGATAPRTTTTSGVTAVVSTHSASTHSAIFAASSPHLTSTSLATSGSAYGGAVFNGPHILPGKFQCEDYDQGGEGVAYHDADSGNDGGAYRSEGVDVEGCGDADGGYDVGWTVAGEWLGYSVQVQNAGTYLVSIRAASPWGGGGLHLEDETGANLTGLLTIPATGSWQSYTTVTASAALTAGPHVLRLVEDSGGYNLNWIAFAFSPTSSPGSSVPGLFATGVDASGAPLADGASDPHYTIISGPDGAGAGAKVTLSDRFPVGDPYWPDDTASSKWVSPQANQNGNLEPAGTYVYRTSFDLTGLDPASVQLTGRLIADDSISDVRLNGTSLGVSGSNYATWLPFLIRSGFRTGVNTLDFVLVNGGTSSTPSGLRVEISGTGNKSTVTAPAVDFLVSASTSQLGAAPTGSASTALTVASLGGFSGSVALSLSGLPSGASNSFTPASSISVSAGTVVADTLTLKTYGVAPGAYPLMLVATSGTLSHSVPLTLTVAPGPSTNAVRLTDAYLSGDGILTHRIEWDGPTVSVNYVGPGSVYNVIITGYSVSRTGGTGTSAGTFTSGDTPFWIDGPPFANPQTQSSQQLQFGTPYTYTVKANYAYTVNGDPNQSGGSGIVTVGYCQVTSVRAAVTDDQAVDSRLDPRYSTNTYLDHNFGATSYRGGLFAGYNNDPARIGRSLLKFALPALPAGQNLWRAGNICAYATRGFAAGTATVYCQRIGDGWAGQTAVWSLAPGLPALPSPLTGIPTVPITYDGSTPINTWQHWRLFPDIFSAMSSGGSLSVALASTDEARPVWIYFAKKEYDATLAPCAVYSYGAPN